jgi:hypothetical protein
MRFLVDFLGLLLRSFTPNVISQLGRCSLMSRLLVSQRRYGNLGEVDTR